MNKLVFLKYFTCHNVHHPKAHSVVLFTSRKRKDLWHQLHLDMRLMRCWASAQHDIRYSILLFLRQEHLGQQVKISRRRKHSDYFRQVRCSIFDFDLFHCFGALGLGQGLNASFEKRFHNATTQFLTPKSMTMASAGAIRDTGWILARSRHPVASRVTLDLPYWAMHLAPYHLIRMANEMASESAAFFSVVDYLSCIIVAK